MVSTLDNHQRTAIASKLADMKAVQGLLITNEQKLLSACDDPDIRERLQDMLEDDEKNINILDDVMVRYGVRSEVEENTQKMVDEVQRLMGGNQLSLYEKVAQHELLKHNQAMTGIIIHKAAQVVGEDIEEAIKPLHTVNFENRAHQEQLKGVMEVLGVRELTGQDAKQGIWTRVQDAVAALTGVIGSTASQNNNTMTIQEAIHADHKKVSKLFEQIEKSEDANSIQAFFNQLYSDLLVHAEAEEQVVYPAVLAFYGEGNTQELYDEQAQMRIVLNTLKATKTDTLSDFKAEIRSLKQAVEDHVRQEESTMFAAIRKNCSDEQQEQLATQFQAAKDRLQQKMTK